MSYHDSGNAYIEALERKGFYRLAGGMFSAVMARPNSNRVIKVFRNKNELDGWAEYVHWATKAGFAGTFAPKIYSFKRYHNFYVAVMERLDRTVSKLEDKESDAYRHYLNWREPSWTEQFQEFHEFITCFKKRFDGFCLDMHDNNWMVRGDDIVLTDPISCFHGPETVPKRWRVRTPHYNQLALPGI